MLLALQPHRVLHDALADLLGDLGIGSRERAHQIGTRDDSDEEAAGVDDRKPVDAPVDHERSCRGHGPFGPDRDYGRRHRLADEVRFDLLDLLEPAGVDQPGERSAVAFDLTALPEENVSLGEHPHEQPGRVDDRQAGDAALDEDTGRVLQRCPRLDGRNSGCHCVFDLHGSSFVRTSQRLRRGGGRHRAMR